MEPVNPGDVDGRSAAHVIDLAAKGKLRKARLSGKWRSTIGRSRSPDAESRGPLSAPSVHRREVSVGIIAWIVLGAIAGWITNMIMGGGEGVIATIILGIIGAVVGGWLAGTVLKVADVTGVNVESIVVARDRRGHRGGGLPDGHGSTSRRLTPRSSATS